MVNEYDKFNGKLWRINNSIVITIPESIVRCVDFKEGEEVKIMIRKIEKGD